MNTFLLKQDNDLWPYRTYGAITTGGVELDARTFVQASSLHFPSGIAIEVDNEGEALDYNTGPFGVPIVSEYIADILSDLASNDVQLLPLDIEGETEKFYVLNVLHAISCIDEERSMVQYWGPNDHRADLAGHFRTVARIKLNSEAAHGIEIFRLAGWKTEIAVSGDLADALRLSGQKGMSFQPAD